MIHARETTKWLALLLVAVAAFYAKLLFTSQFSVLSSYEGANVAYAWFQFTLSSLKHGILPLWNPYTNAGEPFLGEMQTQAFSPLKLLLVLVPFGKDGLFLPKAYDAYLAVAHFLGGCFMFFLIRHLRLKNFAAFFGAVCFAVGGFLGRQGPWSHMLNSGIMLPLVFLMMLKALEADDDKRRSLLFTWLAGAALGVSIISGGFQMVVLQVVALISLAGFWSFQKWRDREESHQEAGGADPPPAGIPQTAGFAWSDVRRPLLVLAAVGAIAFCAAAIQLLPTMEYSPLVYRYGGEATFPATQKIPYAYQSKSFWPQAAFGLLFGFPFSGLFGDGEGFTPYFGVLPFLLTVLAIYKAWDQKWIRYLTALGGVSFFYSLGEYSFLHSFIYSTVPLLWMARTASRTIYLTNFAMAILAAYGVNILFSADAQDEKLRRLLRVCTWFVAAIALTLTVLAMVGKQENPWTFESFLFILAAFALVRHLARAHWTRFTQFLAIGLLLCDFSAFNWTVVNKIDLKKQGKDHLEELLSLQGTAAFLKSQPGLFRVFMTETEEPNLGDVFGIQAAGGMSDSIIQDHMHLRALGNALDLLNVRYTVERNTCQRPGPVYDDGKWKVYENPGAYPRAWLVHDAMLVRDGKQTFGVMAGARLDYRRTALVREPLETSLAGTDPQPGDAVRVEAYEHRRIALNATTSSPALLVLAEIYYPGWKAEVNGRPATIHQVDGALRGIVVPAGASAITLRYAPWTFFVGALLSGLSFLGLLAFVIYLRRSNRKTVARRCAATPA